MINDNLNNVYSKHFSLYEYITENIVVLTEEIYIFRGCMVHREFMNLPLCHAFSFTHIITHKHSLGKGVERQ